MKISVFGLGYVGNVSEGCLAASGHPGWGVGVNGERVESSRSVADPLGVPDI